MERSNRIKIAFIAGPYFGDGSIVALPRWGTSSGARREIAWAEVNDVPVFYLASLDDTIVLDMVARWAKEQ